MDWWDVCAEHGRRLRARQHDTPRAKEIAQEAERLGFSRLDDLYGTMTREPRIGMRSCAAIAALGHPETINENVGAWGTHQQWVYRERRLYLYLDNGTLRSFQR